MSRFWGFPNDVAGCLLLQMGGDSVRAYNNSDLIPNGFIDEFSVLIKQPYGQGRLLPSMIKSRKVLPSDKLYTEIWVQNGSAAIRIPDQFIQPLAGIDIQFWPFIGQITPIDTKYTYHICESETYVNIPIVVDKKKFPILVVQEPKLDENGQVILDENDEAVLQDVEYLRIELPYYILGVLGVTKNPIIFATPNQKLTNEQLAAVATKDVSAGLQIVNSVAYVGDFNLKPNSLLSDTNKRKILEIPGEEYDELENLGNSRGVISGWPLSDTGQIQGKFKLYDYAEAYNLFAYIDRDPRKNNYRADNSSDYRVLPGLGNLGGHAYANGSVDDITEKHIYIKLKGKKQKLTKNTNSQDVNTYVEEISDLELQDKDTIYITYVGAEKLFHRQALAVRNIFYMFGVSANNLLATNIRPLETGPFNSIKQWYYKLKKYRIPKDINKIGMTPAEYRNDKALESKLNTLTASDAATTSTRDLINARMSSFSLEGQRLIETRKNRAVPSEVFVVGCYFIDARGICSVNFRTIEADANPDGAKVLVPAGEIEEQEWFAQTLLNIREKTPSVVFNEQGIINIEQAKTSFFGDFVFDISELANSVFTDNQKYAYEPNLANAIKTYPGGVGLCARLDLLRVLGTNGVAAARGSLDTQTIALTGLTAQDFEQERQTWLQELDVSAAEFQTIKTQGSAAAVACNPYFDTKRFSIGMHLYLRTPLFPEKFGLTTRIYVEKLQGTNLVLPDGTIFIGAEGSTRSFSIAQNNYTYDAVLTYTEAVDAIIKFRVLNSAWTDGELNKILRFEMSPNGSKLVEPQFIGNVSSGPSNQEILVTSTSTNNMPDSLFYNVSYDNVPGNVPNYYKGREVYLHAPTLLGVTAGQRIQNKTKSDIIILDRILGLDKIKLDQDNYYITISKKSGDWPDEDVYMQTLRFKGKFSVGQTANICYNTKMQDVERSEAFDTCASETGASTGGVAQVVKDYFNPLTEFRDRFISLVFPYSKRVIDKIYIDFKEELDSAGQRYASGEYEFDFTIPLGYIQLAAFQIRQRPCIFFSELTITCEDYLYGDEYEKLLVRSACVSSCYDSAGNLLIFYEDNNEDIYAEINAQGSDASLPSLQRTMPTGEILYYDGRHINNIIAQTSTIVVDGVTQLATDLSFSTIQAKEISCLLSPNNGETWFDFKAVVRTCEGENIGTPYAFHDDQTKCVHLFFTVGLDVFHKKIYPNEFSFEDAFYDYLRPKALDRYSPANWGLYHFTPSGIAMRVRPANIVLRYRDLDFSTSLLDKSRNAEGLLSNEPRFIDNNSVNPEEPQLYTVPRPDYFVYRDNRGQLNFVYRMQGKLYVKTSSNDGESWESCVKYGLYIHQNAVSETPSPVRNFGYAYDRKSKRIYISYIANDMLFINDFDANIANDPARAGEENVEILSNIRRQLEVGGQKPVFVCGKIPESLIKYIQEGGLNFVFPYFTEEYTKFIIANNSNYDISDIAAKGYVLGDGRVRFFYEDSYGNLRGFTYDQVPMFDFNIIGRND